MEAWYKSWFNSPYYHQLYFDRDEKEAALFIDKLTSHLNPRPNSRMLDVACGKGRHALQLANKGFDVTGIDLSEHSIKQALEHEKENLHFYRHDMRLPFWINYFDVALNLFTSFGYFDAERENNNAIQTISAALKKKGIFVMDYLNVGYTINHLEPYTEKEMNNIHYTITKWDDDKFFYKKIEIKEEKLNYPKVFTEKVQKFTLNNFTDMFARCGLEIKEVFGDYQLNSYDYAATPRLIMIAG